MINIKESYPIFDIFLLPDSKVQEPMASASLDSGLKSPFPKQMYNVELKGVGFDPFNRICVPRNSIYEEKI